jgi:hypothetical protein
MHCWALDERKKDDGVLGYPSNAKQLRTLMQNSESFYIIFLKDSNYLSIFDLLLFQPEVRVSVYHGERNNLMEFVTDKICSSL